MSDLKPCPTPWCDHSESPYVWQGPDDLFCVICGACQVEGPMRQSEGDAVNAWNESLTSSDRALAWRDEAAKLRGLFAQLSVDTDACAVSRQYARQAMQGEAHNLSDIACGLADRVAELEAFIKNPPPHKFWGAGEPDCPSGFKCGNGELHTMKCKACGVENPRDNVCRASISGAA